MVYLLIYHIQFTSNIVFLSLIFKYVSRHKCFVIKLKVHYVVLIRRKLSIYIAWIFAITN